MKRIIFVCLLFSGCATIQPNRPASVSIATHTCEAVCSDKAFRLKWSIKKESVFCECANGDWWLLRADGPQLIEQGGL